MTTRCAVCGAILAKGRCPAASSHPKRGDDAEVWRAILRKPRDQEPAS